MISASEARSKTTNSSNSRFMKLCKESIEESITTGDYYTVVNTKDVNSDTLINAMHELRKLGYEIDDDCHWEYIEISW